MTLTPLGSLWLVAGAASVLLLPPREPVSVRVTAPHPGLVARVSGPTVTLVRGQRIRAGDGFVIISTPAEVLVDPKLRDFFFRLEPDTAWVTVEVESGSTILSACASNVVVGYEATNLVVTGTPAREPPSP